MFWASPLHSPSQISSRLYPACWACTRSVRANTAHRVEIFGGGDDVCEGPLDELLHARKAEAARLLVEEAARARGAGGVGPRAAVLPVLVEAHQPELLPARVQDGADPGTDPAGGRDQSDLWIDDAPAAEDGRSAGGAGASATAKTLHLPENPREGLADLPLVDAILSARNVPCSVQDCR